MGVGVRGWRDRAERNMDTDVSTHVHGRRCGDCGGGVVKRGSVIMGENTIKEKNPENSQKAKYLLQRNKDENHTQLVRNHTASETSVGRKKPHQPRALCFKN